MLTIVGMFAIIVCASMFTACSQDDSQLYNSHDDSLVEKVTMSSLECSEYGMLSYPAGVVRLSDFEENGHLYTEEDLIKLVDLKSIGNAPDNAIVILLFNNDNILLTPHEYNSIYSLDDELLSNLKIFYTDISDFKKITWLPYSTSEYVNIMDGIWRFDPYVITYKKRIDIEKSVQEKTVPITRGGGTGVQSYFIKGNFLYGEFGYVSDYTGHVAGITSNLNASYTTNNIALSNLYVVEALPFEGWSVVGHYATDTSTDGDWATTSCSNRKIAYPNSNMTITDLNRSLIASLMGNTVGCPYSLSTSKTSVGYYYCSKIIWQAYYNALGVDLDSDGGYWVFPNDLLNDTRISSISF